MTARTRGALLLAGLVLGLTAGPAAAQGSAALNQPSAWETATTTCSKTELVVDGTATWTLADDGSAHALLVLKAGQGRTVVEQPVAGVAYAPADGKDISHVIVCVTTGDDGGIVVN